jgi:WD40 repeat protein
MELKGHKSQVMCAAISADNKRAVTASKDGMLRVWDINVRYELEEDPKSKFVVRENAHQAVGCVVLCY